MTATCGGGVNVTIDVSARAAKIQVYPETPRSRAGRCFQAFDGAPVNRSASDWASLSEHFPANWALVCRELPQFNGSDFDDGRPSVFQNGIGNLGEKEK
jgi:hypothetical protein